MRVLTYIPGRLLSAVLVLFGASVLIFIAIRSIPGDYATLILGPFATESAKDVLRAEYGLDRSLPEQYAIWIGAALRGDFGTSSASGTPVVAEIADRLPVTLLLSAMAIVLTVAIGIPLGVWTALRARSRGHAVGRVFSVLGISLPEFVVGAVAVYVFSKFAPGISVGHFVTPQEDFWGSLGSLALPAVVLSVFCVAATARTTRVAVLDVLVEPHITSAVARGESKGFIVRHHVLRNAITPVLTLTATITASLLGGAVIVESVFNAPGVGSYLVLALGRRDYAAVQAGVLLATCAFVVMNLLVDVSAGVVDPRLSYGRRARA